MIKQHAKCGRTQKGAPLAHLSFEQGSTKYLNDKYNGVGAESTPEGVIGVSHPSVERGS